MTEPKWSIADEFMRMAETYIQKQKPTSISDLFDLFEKAAAPKTPGARTGFDDFVDDPRAATPPPQKETSMAKNRVTNKIPLYPCPACSTDVFGTATYELATAAVPTLDETGRFVAEMELVGMKADAHDCRPKTTR